ncbi:MAG: AAA family ATPase, partial [Ignavibacteria bacterium]
DFGQEAIEILLKEMSDGKGDLAVIVAGYPKEMKYFLESNPGLKSRFNMYFDFPDYDQNELLQIAEYTASKRNLVLTGEAKKYLYEQLVEAYRNRDRTFGNARFVNSIIEESKMNLGTRIMSDKNSGSTTKEDLMTIKSEDIEKVFERENDESPELPIDEDLLRESLSKLNDLIGLQNIKTEIQEIVKLVKFYRETGKNVRRTFSVHSVFTGNPGTGKTTVARIVSEIYKALGILERGHLVECDREALVGGYIGQTAIKTSELIERATGGVLFIDEAYSLIQNSSNDFGHEAVQILLKRMEDMRGEFGVICAGYTDNMEEFLRSNPGLRSRFDKIMEFEDYTKEELFQIALHILRQNEITPDEKASAHLKEYLTALRKTADKYFGNAREVRRIITEAIKNQHLRLSEIPKDKRTKQMMCTLTLEDVSEFSPDELKPKKHFGFALER